MSGLWALLLLEVRTAVRDRTVLTMLVLTGLSGALLRPGLRAFDAATADTVLGLPPALGVDGPTKSSGVTCPEVGRPTLALVGEAPPPWWSWPTPTVVPEHADVVVTVSTDEDGVTELLLGGPSEELVGVARVCLQEEVGRVREERWATLGLEQVPAATWVRAERTTTPAPSGTRSFDPSPLGGLLATLALLLAPSIAIEAVPRRRASGLLEQLRSTQTTEGELVVAWVLTAIGLTAAAMALAASLFVLTSWGELGPVEPAVHAVALAAVLAAATLRSSLTATDVQSATLRFVVLFLGMLATCGLAGWLFGVWPWLGALVPFGGSFLACSGMLGGWGWWADLGALVWTVLLLGWSARSLAGEDSAGAGGDPMLQRRATGNWVPEVGILAAFGASTAVLSGGAGGGTSPWIGITVAFVAFMLLPALAAGPVLGIPRAELLPLGRPRARDLALAVPVVVGMLGLAFPVLAVSLWVLPSNELVRQFSREMTELVTSPFGRVAIGLYPAVCEEFLYRGVILGLLRRGWRPGPAVVGQAVAFALAHVISVRLPWTFCFGLVLGWVRVRTGSLWACMAIHFLFNVAAGLGSVWMVEALPTELPGVLWLLPVGVGVLAVFAMAPARPPEPSGEGPR